jgi:hypothetical protein
MRAALLVIVLVMVGVGTYQLSSGVVSGTVKGIPCLRLPPDVCQKPMGDVQVRFDAEVGGVSTAATTMHDGTFRIHLLPGKYGVHVQLFADDHLLEGPNQLTVWPFSATQADFLIPSGLQ